MSDKIVSRAQAALPTGASRLAAGSRNKATLAAATLLDGGALGLTRRAVVQRSQATYWR
jgi:hypothetical protein